MKDAGLVNKTIASNINTPLSTTESIVFVDPVDGLIKSKDSSGVVTIGSGTGLSASIAVDGTGLIYTATPVGGTAPYSYAWSNAFIQKGGGVPTAATFSGSVVTAVGTLNNVANTGGLIRCKVTDANGLVSYAYYLYNNLT